MSFYFILFVYITVALLFDHHNTSKLSDKDSRIGSYRSSEGCDGNFVASLSKTTIK